MGINGERANFVVAILLANGANRFGGMSAEDITNAIPDLPKRTVYRILKRPGFKECDRAIWPKQYWYDASSVRHPVGKVAKPETDLAPYDGKRFIETIPKASNELLKIHTYIEALKHDEKNKFHYQIDSLEIFAWNLLTRVQQTKDHPLYDTPEWWRIYNDVEN